MPSSFTNHLQVSEEIMAMLGREDTALLLLARSRYSPHEFLEDIMQVLCAKIEHEHYFGTINRATGPLNSEANPTSNGNGDYESHGRDGAWITANYPMLAFRNDAMLEEARRLTGLYEDQLWHVVQIAMKIKKTRESGESDPRGGRL
jgi:hypothetical protein